MLAGLDMALLVRFVGQEHDTVVATQWLYTWIGQVALFNMGEEVVGVFERP